MIRKIAVALLCALFIACFVLAGFMAIYFALPSRKARASIELAQTVSDPSTEKAEETASTEPSEEKDTTTYVADVHSFLSLRQTPDSGNEEGVIYLPPMTHMQAENFVDGNKGNRFAYVTVSSGEYEGSQGYVNADYITRLGEETRYVDFQEN